MIPQQKLKQISQQNRSVFINKHADKPVRIFSKQWGAYWRTNGGGYTDHPDTAGTYTFRQAINASLHAGPEKGIHYEFIRPKKIKHEQPTRTTTN